LGQTRENDNGTNLYNYIDSLFSYQLGYEYNEDSKAGTTTTVYHTNKNNTIHFALPSLPKNPEPIILLDGVRIKKQLMKYLTLESIQQIEVLKPGISSTVIFGSSGRNGTLIITSKQKSKNTGKV
jgi:hypothetical protein